MAETLAQWVVSFDENMQAFKRPSELDLEPQIHESAVPTR